MRTISECLGENVKRLRLERGFTQEGFSRHAKVSISFLQNIEHGKKWAGPRTITILARALQVPEDELFRDCKRKAQPDPKEFLLAFCHHFGVVLPEETATALQVRRPPVAYLALYERMPDAIAGELTELCQSESWDWDGFRTRMRA